MQKQKNKLFSENNNNYHCYKIKNYNVMYMVYSSVQA